MSAKLLVAYASKYGATREIAERIAEVLGRSGIQVALRPAEDVTSVAAFDGVVLGSAVYSADWLPEAAELLESFQETLSTKPVWLFSSGPTSPGDPVEVLGGWTHPAGLAALIDAVGPRDIALFSGKIDADRLELEDWLLNRSVRGAGGDYRDWEVIESWAAGIARQVAEQPIAI